MEIEAKIRIVEDEIQLIQDQWSKDKVVKPYMPNFWGSNTFRLTTRVWQNCCWDKADLSHKHDLTQCVNFKTKPQAFASPHLSATIAPPPARIGTDLQKWGRVENMGIWGHKSPHIWYDWKSHETTRNQIKSNHLYIITICIFPRREIHICCP